MALEGLEKNTFHLLIIQDYFLTFAQIITVSHLRVTFEEQVTRAVVVLGTVQMAIQFKEIYHFL
jgi:hypothetical protein